MGALQIVGALLAVFFSMVFGVQLYALWKARRARGLRVEGLGGPLGEAIGSGRRVAAYFWSPTCAACRVQTRVIEKLTGEFPDIYSVNVASDPAPARALGILGTPALAVFRGGIVREIVLGARTEEKIRTMLRP